MTAPNRRREIVATADADGYGARMMHDTPIDHHTRWAILGPVLLAAAVELGDEWTMKRHLEEQRR